MLIRVDEIEGQDNIEGYSYQNSDGGMDTVVFDVNVVCLSDDVHPRTVFRAYIKDIPNLIKALQAAYDYKEKTI